MCVDVCTSEPERHVCFWSGFNIKAERFPRQRNWRRRCECAVTSPPTVVNLVTTGSLATNQILAKLVNRILGYGDGGCTCARARCPTPPMTCGKHVLSDPQPTYQIWTQSVKPFLRYISAVCTCARAEIFHPWLVLSTYFMTSNHTPKLNPISEAVPEIQKRGLHVGTWKVPVFETFYFISQPTSTWNFVHIFISHRPLTYCTVFWRKNIILRGKIVKKKC